MTERIIAKLPAGPRRIHRLRAGSLVILVILLAVVVFLAGLPGVASAFRQWFGFLPGVGIVDRSAPVRVLQEPVSRERNGLTVTVEQVTALSDRTVIHYKVSGIPPFAYPKNLPGSDPQGFQNGCLDPVFIRLPDGRALTYTGFNAISSTQNVPEYETDFTLNPVPGGIDKVKLVMPCIDGTEREAIPGAWEFPLQLVAMPENTPLIPVNELLLTPTPAQTGAEVQSSVNPQAANVSGSSDTDIQLEFDKVVVLPDGDLVYGSLIWDEAEPYSLVEPDSYEWVDAQGQRLPITQVSPDPSQMPVPGSRKIPLAFKVDGPIRQPGPVTLKVDRLRTSLPVKDARFTLDTSSPLNENQQWLLNQDIQAGSYTIRVVSIAPLSDGYQFTFETGPEIGCVDVYIQGTNYQHGMCGQGVTILEYDGDAPTGKLTIIIANLEVFLSGTWQASWLPPEAEPINPAD